MLQLQCDEPSTQGYDSLAVPIPEHRHTPADADRGAGPHMPVKNLVHRSPHRKMSSEIDTPGCPAATAERRRNADDPGVCRTAPLKTNPGLTPQLRPTHHCDETQLPGKGSGG